MSYKVIPFNQVNNPTKELESIIQRESTDGFKYVSHQYSDKLKPGSAGCFGIGARADETTHVGFVVFEKE